MTAWWTKQQACEHLGIGARRFEKYVQDGMKVVKIGRNVYVRPDVIQTEYRRRQAASKASRHAADPAVDR
jgi:hypothetical protein